MLSLQGYRLMPAPPQVPFKLLFLVFVFIFAKAEYEHISCEI